MLIHNLTNFLAMVGNRDAVNNNKPIILKAVHYTSAETVLDIVLYLRSSRPTYYVRKMFSNFIVSVPDLQYSDLDS